MKNLKRILFSTFSMIILVFVVLFLNWNIDIWPVFFIERSNKIMKKYLPEDFVVRKNNNLVISKDCLKFMNGSYDCKQIYRKSVWQNSSWDLFDIWAVFQNHKWSISLSNLAVSPFDSVVNTMDKIDNWDWDNFEILKWSGYEWIDEFFH